MPIQISMPVKLLLQLVDDAISLLFERYSAIISLEDIEYLRSKMVREELCDGRSELHDDHIFKAAYPLGEQAKLRLLLFASEFLTPARDQLFNGWQGHLDIAKVDSRDDVILARVEYYFDDAGVNGPEVIITSVVLAEEFFLPPYRDGDDRDDLIELLEAQSIIVTISDEIKPLIRFVYD